MGFAIYDPFLGKIRYSFAAGPGIDITGGVISVITPPEGVPYVAGTGIGINGATITNTLSGSGRIEVAGATAAFNPEADIVTVTGTSVTLQPDTAYKIYATAAAVTLNANPPAAGKWAYEGHLEIFVASTGYIVTGSNVVLANALEPDSVNNCTVRFHDGLAIIAVEDHVAGYIVVSATGTADGSLPYGIDTSVNEYIAFDATLNGTTIDLSGSTANGEKHVVGNGYTETTLTGDVNCGTSKFTVANLSLQNVAVNGGKITIGDAFIPSGSTVSVATGAGITLEKVFGADATSVLDLTDITSQVATTSNSVTNINNLNILCGSVGSYQGAFIAYGGTINASNTVFSGGRAPNTGAAIYVTLSSGCVNFSGCTISGNQGGFAVTGGATANIYDTIVSGNLAGNHVDIRNAAATINMRGCTIGTYRYADGSNGKLYLFGTNKIDSVDAPTYSGSVTLASGAILDLTGNTNTTPVAPGGSITFEQGGATVQLGAAAGTVDSSYMLDNVALPAGAKLTNTAEVNLGGKSVYIGSGTTASASGCNFTSGLNTVQLGSNGGGFLTSSASVAFTSCSITGCTATRGGAVYVSGGSFTANHVKISSCFANAGRALYLTGGQMTLVSCELGANSTADNIGAVMIRNGGQLIAVDCSFNDDKLGFDLTESDTNLGLSGSNAIFGTVLGTSGTVTISGGAIVDLTGNTNATSINPGGGVTVLDGGCQVITSAGATVSLAAGTYTQINNDGTTVPPQPEPAEE